jgi:hypothetical protein
LISNLPQCDPDAVARDGALGIYFQPFFLPGQQYVQYIDFIAHPGSRKDEYYGNYFAGSALLDDAPGTG